MTAPRIAYVVASWGGHRSEVDYPAAKILEGHFEALDGVASSSRTILVVPDNLQGNKEGYDQVVEAISAKPGILTLRRQNKGYSYGSYSDAFAAYRDQFDYWLFYEDDYYPVGHCFDRAWVNVFEKAREKYENLGFLCGLKSYHNAGLHASVSIGITTTEVLEKVWELFGCLPHYYKDHPDLWKPEWFNSQVGFSKGFIEAGYTIRDIVEFGYRTPFWHSRKKVLVYTDQPKNGEGPMLFFPGQCWEERR